MDLALIVRRSIAPTLLAATIILAANILATVVLHVGQAHAQSESMDQACAQAFKPLREEAQNRGRLIKAASERHAPPDEACKLIGDFVQSEIKMINLLESSSGVCAVSWRLAEQLKIGHRKTEALRSKVCAMVGDFEKIR